jgi:hypothetical protein
LIRFAESVPAGNSVKLRIDTPLTFAAAGASMPHISSTPPVQGHRYLSVPSRLEGTPMTWNATGVKAAELPVALGATAAALTHVQTFESTGESFQLMLQTPTKTAHTPRARLADATVFLDPRGGQFITTRFCVDPQGLQHCTLRLPDSQQLVAVYVAGSPAQARQVNGNDWLVALGPPHLPSIFEIVSRSRDGAANTRRSEIRRPALLAGSNVIPVDINLWSLGYLSAAPRPAIGIAAEATVAEQAVLRFEQLLNVAESATAAAIQSPAPDGYHWYRPWSTMLTQLRSEAAEALAKPDSRHSVAQISRPPEEQFTASAARLDAWIEQCTKTLPGATAGEEAVELRSGDGASDDGDASSKRWVYCVTDGALDRLTVQNMSNDLRPWQSQVVGLLAIVSLSVGAMMVMRRPGALDLFYQWPHAVGFLVGMAWWAWLQPSWFGLVIAAACVAPGLRSGWPGRAIRLDASTVLRASRPK